MTLRELWFRLGGSQGSRPGLVDGRGHSFIRSLLGSFLPLSLVVPGSAWKRPPSARESPPPGLVRGPQLLSRAELTSFRMCSPLRGRARAGVRGARAGAGGPPCVEPSVSTLLPTGRASWRAGMEWSSTLSPDMFEEVISDRRGESSGHTPANVQLSPSQSVRPPWGLVSG